MTFLSFGLLIRKEERPIRLHPGVTVKVVLGVLGTVIGTQRLSKR